GTGDGALRRCGREGAGAPAGCGGVVLAAGCARRCGGSVRGPARGRRRGQPCLRTARRRTSRTGAGFARSPEAGADAPRLSTPGWSSEEAPACLGQLGPCGRKVTLSFHWTRRL